MQSSWMEQWICIALEFIQSLPDTVSRKRIGRESVGGSVGEDRWRDPSGVGRESVGGSVGGVGRGIDREEFRRGSLWRTVGAAVEGSVGESVGRSAGGRSGDR